jgi:hypothetical protein
VDVPDEIDALGRFYRTAGAARRVARLFGPLLARYAELVLSEGGFEVITGGVGGDVERRLGEIALALGSSRATVDAFRACARAFPGAMCGVKAPVGPLDRASAAPTLYVRTMAPRDEVLAFVARFDGFAAHVGALRALLAETRVLYGLGFCELAGETALKTYTIGDVGGAPGFLSYRVGPGGILREHKRYLPDVPLASVRGQSPAMSGVLALARALGYARLGHVGVAEEDGRPPVTKLYVERVGAIPTDLEAR